MPNKQNLKPFKKGDSSNKAVNGRLGGIASGQAKREKKTFRKAAELILSLPVNGDVKKEVKRHFPAIPENELDNLTAINAAMTSAAMKGNVKAATFLRDSMGEQPKNIPNREETDEQLRQVVESLSRRNAAFEKPAPKRDMKDFDM